MIGDCGGRSTVALFQLWGQKTLSARPNGVMGLPPVTTAF
ncbi:hypothetical protein DCCM_3811 [Desulfocucumis palustris]|uniref:Uncharacterized protein n=1 Tax=Desulfocucumis palustris TaxID=1898651 RepID=A0A2L2XL73_9FIRM|nr:hypothetical protein DCCM_3811 [Desulfocucumis palustris]